MGALKTGRSKRRCSFRSFLLAIATTCCVVYSVIIGSLIQHHNHNNHEEASGNIQRLQLSRFESSVRGELRLSSSSSAFRKNLEPIGECAINLFGLPRSFKDHVLPSLVTNVISVNQKYQCDYFVHFFNVTHDEESLSSQTKKSRSSSSTNGAGANNRGAIVPQEVYLLKEAVEGRSGGGGGKKGKGRSGHVGFVSDTNEEFIRDRKAFIDEIIFGTGGNQSSNPYFYHESSFTEQSLWNILKMWHSQDRVWNLMEDFAASLSKNNIPKKKYRRVAMLRLDVIYTTKIDVYQVPSETVPSDYNNKYLESLMTSKTKEHVVEYSYDYGKQQNSHCVVPSFHSFPVNDRYFAGPYEAVKIWAKDRFSRAQNHVQKVLPALESQRLQHKEHDTPDKFEELAKAWERPQKMTDYGLYDEIFVAHSLLPAILESNPNISVRVDRNLHFARVRHDGSIWLKDKPGRGKVRKRALEKALGRKCTGDPYENRDLDAKSPGRWQIKCPPPF